MRSFISLALLCALALGQLTGMTTPAAAQQEAVPERRLATSRDVDFHGGDMVPHFDTTLAACRIICLGDPACVGFTFNQRSRACFPKAEITGDLRSFEGAISARIITTTPGTLARAAAAQARLGFLPAHDLSAARNFALTLVEHYNLGEWSPQDHANAARAAEASGAATRARAHYGAAMTASDEAAFWLAYARLNLEDESLRGNARREADRRAYHAALGAYLRATDETLAANALHSMAEALESLRRGRDMIPVLRLAQTHVPGAGAALLEHAVARYGFRVLDTRVESDSAMPRICIILSEDLAPGVDLAPFLQTPLRRLTVSGEGQELCVEGLEHGESYSLTLREGLPAASGEVLARSAPLEFYVRDRAPMVRFPGRGYVLPAAGPVALPVETVNTTLLELNLRRISDRNLAATLRDGQFARPLTIWEDQALTDTMAETVWQGQGVVEQVLNRTVTTRLPLDGISLEPGVYMLHAAVPGTDRYDVPPASQWFMVSDLGLTTLAGVDGLHVVVLHLTDATPAAGARVALVSRGNRVLAQAETDDAGLVRFDAALSRGTGNAAPALVTVETDGDMAFLPLTDPEFDLSDRGVEGREPSPPIDVFLTTERGAYRAGETVHATALTRDDRASAVEGLPLTARLLRPDGVEYARAMADAAMLGGHVFALPLAASAPRGAWRLEVLADPDAPALASQSFLVEDFLPERIDFTLNLPEGALDPLAPPELLLEARYLFGAPAAGLPLEGDVVLRATDSLEAFPGYRFGRHDQSFSPARQFFASGLQTDAAGQLRAPLPLPEVTGADRPLVMDLRATLAEGSGRPVERRVSRPLRAMSALPGIRPGFDDALPENATAHFDLILAGPDGMPVPGRIDWQIDRVETRYQWFTVDGRWNWQPVTTRSRIAEGREMAGTAPVQASAALQWGRYEIRAASETGASASIGFNAGWFAPAGVRETPDMLELALDRDSYAPGDVARLRMVPREAGMALVSVLSNRVIDLQLVPVAAGANTLDLPVTEAWGAGAYVTASVLRPMDMQAGRNPARSLGLAHAAIDPGARLLEVRLDAPAEAQPRGPMTVVLELPGLAAGDSAYATLAAVDLGILNLTGFAPPEPATHYFGQRRLGVAIRDLYGRLIDGMTGTMGELRSGGDAASAGMQAPPPTEELLALFTGPVALQNGRAEISLDLPAFNGTVRLMAMAWSAAGLGQASADVLVRDPVVVQASLPRFMAPGDESRLLLELTHTSGPAGRMALDVTGPGIDPAQVPGVIDLPEQGSARLSIPIVADAAGLAQIGVTLTPPDGAALHRVLNLPVQINDPEISRSSRFTLAPGQSFVFDDAALAGLIPASASATLAAGPGALLDAPGLMRRLAGYPYGCTEQVTSAALPLLLAGDLASEMGLATPQEARARIDAAISRVFANQSGNGSFGLWHASSGDLWLDAYVTDFLSRARAAGHPVPGTALRMALDNLRNRINYAPDFTSDGAPYAYALYVLAREGAAAVGDLRYYADTRAGAFDTPLAAAQLGAALATYGDPVRADAMFRHARDLLDRPARSGWRDDYGTALRDAAGLLSLAVESGSEVVDRSALAARIASRPAAAALSPQEAVWSLRAAQALRHDPPGLSIDDTPASGTLAGVRSAGDAVQRITNTGTGDATLTLTAFGVPQEPEPAGGEGYRISRSYYHMDGTPADPAFLRIGDRLVTVLEITAFEEGQARLMVDDPLPAGFEIDNPNLIRAGDIAALSWLQAAEWAEMTEARQERFLAALDWGGRDSLRLAYIVRAVSPGTFHHPAAQVEDMYRPTRRARTAPGRVTIAE